MVLNRLQKHGLTLLQLFLFVQDFKTQGKILLFFKTISVSIIFHLTYVDVVTDSIELEVQGLIKTLSTQLSLKYLGQLSYFIGIEVHHLENKYLLIAQSKYIKYLLVKEKMEGCKLISTPMVSNISLSASSDVAFDNPRLYKSIVGALQYISLTRPYLSFGFNKCYQFMAISKISHWFAIKKVLRYLCGNLMHGLVLMPSSQLVV